MELKPDHDKCLSVRARDNVRIITINIRRQIQTYEADLILCSIIIITFPAFILIPIFQYYYSTPPVLPFET